MSAVFPRATGLSSKEPRHPIDTILLIGPTGAGKSPLGEQIAAKGLLGRRCHHLDFGAELRASLSQTARSARYSPGELAFIDGVLEQGLLLENEHFALAEKIISLFLDRVCFLHKDVLVLNGIPRHEGQARDLARITKMHAVIVLDCSREKVFCRIRDNAGGDRTERADDEIELIGRKLETFWQRTAPLCEYYRGEGVRIYSLEVTATMTPHEAYEKVSALTRADPPVALVTEPPQR